MASIKDKNGSIFDLSCAQILLSRYYMKLIPMTFVIFLSLSAFSYTKLELYPNISLNDKDKSKFHRSSKEESAIKALKDKSIAKSDIAISDYLTGLSKEIAADLTVMEQAKALAKKAVYESIKKNWSANIEFTALNDIGASSFAEISEDLVKKINDESHYYGPYKIKDKSYFLFSIANISQVIVAQDLKSARVFIQYDNKNDRNTLQDLKL